jgi:hypothetical protein
VPLFSKTKLTHQAALSLVMSTATGIQFFLPTPQWKAGFEYLTKKSISNKPQFDHITAQPSENGNIVKAQNALQTTLLNEVLPQVIASMEKLKALESQISDSSPIIADNQFFYGGASFQDGLNRYGKIGSVEYHFVMANLYATIHNLLYACAFDLEQLPKLSENLGRVVGFDAMGSNISGLPLNLRTAEILRVSPLFKTPAYGDLFTPVSNAKDLLSVGNSVPGKWNALRALRLAAEEGEKSWEAAKARKDSKIDEQFVFNLPGFNVLQKQGDLIVANIKSVLGGEAAIRNAMLSGDDGSNVVKTNLPNFYANPFDLKGLLPTKFDESNSNTASKPELEKNYNWGVATEWNPGPYKVFLPDVTKSSDVPSAVRTLSQSWGGPLAGIPLSGNLF